MSKWSRKRAQDAQKALAPKQQKAAQPPSPQYCMVCGAAVAGIASSRAHTQATGHLLFTSSASVAARSSFEEAGVASLPVRNRTEPIVAWRHASLVRDGKRWRWQSVNPGHGMFDADAIAECKLSHDHVAPARGCQCGFYALTVAPAFGGVYGGSGAWLLRVQLSGKVIRATHGYRAQHQRVVGAAPGPCAANTGRGSSCLNAPTHIVVSPVAIAPVCAEHVPTTVPLDDFMAPLGVPLIPVDYTELFRGS